MKRTNRWAAGILAAGIAATLVPATRAHASSEGRRNTALAATAAAAFFGYQYAQKPSTKRAVPAVAAVGAAGYAWYNHSKKSKAEQQAQRARWVSYGRRTATKSRTAGYRGAAKSSKHRGHSKSYCQRHCR